MPIHDWGTVPDAVFHSSHVAWLGRLQDRLNNEILPEPFYALTETITGEAIPDLITLQAQAPSVVQSKESRSPSAGTSIHDDTEETAVAVAPCPPLVQDLGREPYDRLARRIVIRNAWEGDALVAVLEIVSRGNKTSRVKVAQIVEKIFQSVPRKFREVLLARRS